MASITLVNRFTRRRVTQRAENKTMQARSTFDRLVTNRRRLLAMLIAGAVSGASVTVPTSPRAEVPQQAVNGAAQFMQLIADQAIRILQTPNGTLEQREAQFRGLLAEGFDLDFISRFVLGKYWRRASAEERADYQALFREYILKTYSRRLGGYSGETFQIKGARAAGKQDVIVSTLILQPNGPAIAADWRVRVYDNGYRIIDIMIEGVSMAITQRDEFATVVRSQGMQGLLQALRARTQMFSVANK